MQRPRPIAHVAVVMGVAIEGLGAAASWHLLRVMSGVGIAANATEPAKRPEKRVVPRHRRAKRRWPGFPNAGSAPAKVWPPSGTAKMAKE